MRCFTFCFHTKFSRSTLYFVLLCILSQGWSHSQCPVATGSWWLLCRAAQLCVVDLCTPWSRMALSVLSNKSSLQLLYLYGFFQFALVPHTVVSDFHKCSGWNNAHLLPYISWGQVFKWGQRTLFFLDPVREDQTLAFFRFWSLHSLVWDSILLTSTAGVASSLTLTLLPLSGEEFCDYNGPIWIIQDNLKIPQILNSTPHANSLLLCKATYSQVLGMKK